MKLYKIFFGIFLIFLYAGLNDSIISATIKYKVGLTAYLLKMISLTLLDKPSVY